MNREDSRM